MHIKHSPWTPEEDLELRTACQGILGERVNWLEVARRIPGRSDKMCHGRWVTLQARGGLGRETPIQTNLSIPDQRQNLRRDTRRSSRRNDPPPYPSSGAKVLPVGLALA